MYIAVDFDGTCVTNEFPNVGKDIGASIVLKELINNEHKIILYTMRGIHNSDGVDELTPAVNWFKENGIELFGINENPADVGWWTDSRKVFAELYIDDLALGTPLIYRSEGKFVDWLTVFINLHWMGLFKKMSMKRYEELKQEIQQKQNNVYI